MTFSSEKRPVHPRDFHVRSFEAQQRSNEGDVVDTSGVSKVAVDLNSISETSSAATVTFTHEDHSLGNALRHILMADPTVTAAGYSIPHPLEPKMVMHVQSTGYAIDAVASGLEHLANVCDQLRVTFDASVAAP